MNREVLHFSSLSTGTIESDLGLKPRSRVCQRPGGVYNISPACKDRPPRLRCRSAGGPQAVITPIIPVIDSFKSNWEIIGALEPAVNLYSLGRTS